MKLSITTIIVSTLIAFSAMGQTTENTSITTKNIHQNTMKSLKIERHFNVAPERVFAIFTNPKEMIVWWTEDTQFDIDLQVGGNYSIIREEDGATYNMTGEYLEIDIPNKLQYTCAMPDFSPNVDTITINIQPDGKGGSHMIFIQEGEGIDAELKELPKGTVSESEKGWQMGFDLMVEYWESQSDMKQQIIPFLTFQKNDAEQAMNLYVSLFENSKIIDVNRWSKEGPGKEGTIMQALFQLNGQKFMCSDSPPVHNWDFTPAVSNFIECKDESELERLFSKLSENGDVAMPLDNYGFSQKFGWVVDQFGVSWQLNLQ